LMINAHIRLEVTNYFIFFTTLYDIIF
jgi:hypothetical protein